MALYMYQASYTAKSMAAQLTEPHDPMEAIGPTLEELGATILVAGYCWPRKPSAHGSRANCTTTSTSRWRCWRSISNCFEKGVSARTR